MMREDEGEVEESGRELKRRRKGLLGLRWRKYKLFSNGLHYDLMSCQSTTITRLRVNFVWIKVNRERGGMDVWGEEKGWGQAKLGAEGERRGVEGVVMVKDQTDRQRA